MTFDYSKIQKPYPMLCNMILRNGNILPVQIIHLEGRGCLIEMKTQFIKTSDRVKVDFRLREGDASSILEPTMVAKIYIEIIDNKPHYLAELLFLKIKPAAVDAINAFLSENKKKVQFSMDLPTTSKRPAKIKK